MNREEDSTIISMKNLMLMRKLTSNLKTKRYKVILIAQKKDGGFDLLIENCKSLDKAMHKSKV